MLDPDRDPEVDDDVAIAILNPIIKDVIQHCSYCSYCSYYYYYRFSVVCTYSYNVANS